MLEINKHFLKEKFLMSQKKKFTIERKKLLEKFYFYLDSKVISINAPIGFGKTTFLLDFSTKEKHAFSILLNKNDDNITNFFYRVFELFQKINRSLFKNISLKFDTESELSYKISLLANSLNSVKKNVYIIIQDFHNIKNDRIHDYLLLLIKNTNKNIHFIISSRTKLPFIFAKLKFSDDLKEIQSDMFLFSKEEVLELFNKANIKLTNNNLAIIMLKTEGWILSIQHLIYLLLEPQNESKSIIELFENINNNYLFNYLETQVLSNFDQDFFNFLIKTSFLKFFNYELCNKLLNIDYSYKFIYELEKKQLFIFEIDNNWYKYYSFLNDFLLNRLRLESEFIYFELCKRASTFFDNKKLYDDALYYAFLTNDYNFIANIAENASISFIAKQSYANLKNILDKIPKHIIFSKIKLSLYLAYTELALNNDIEYIQSILENAKNLIKVQKNEDSSEEALLNFIYTLFYLFKRAPVHIIKKHSNLTLKKIYTFESQIIPVICFNLTLSMISIHDFDEGLKIIDEGINQSKSVNDIVRSKLQKALIFIIKGELNYAENLLNSLHIYVEENNYTDSKVNLFKYLMVINAYKYNLPLYYKYKNLLDKEVEISKNIKQKFFAYYYELGFSLMLGKIDDFYEIKEKVNGLDFNQNNSYLKKHLDDLFTNLYILENEISKIKPNWEIEALKYINDVFSGKIDRVRSLEKLVIKTIIIIKLYIKKGLLIEADKIADNALKIIDKLFLDRVIEIYVLKVVINKKNEPKAKNLLKKAISLAENNEFISFFIVNDEIIKKLLISIYNELLKIDKNKSLFLAKILSNFNKIEDVDFMNILTKKEYKVFKLVFSGKSNKEIADKLEISINTLKTHIKNIYKKLEANNKNEAVEKAKVLGLI